MLKKRVGYMINIDPIATKRIKKNKCPACGLLREKWTRKNFLYNCCSKKCTAEYHDMVEMITWDEMRTKSLIRDNYHCIKCGLKVDKPTCIIDHIKPIALGGEEFNLDNLQTLCLNCNKIKTASDMKDIAKERKNIKILKKYPGTKQTKFGVEL